MPSGLPQRIVLPSIGELVLEEYEHDWGDGTGDIDSRYETPEPIQFGDQGEVTISIWVSNDKPLDLPAFTERTETRMQALRERASTIIRDSVGGWEDQLRNSGPENTSPEDVARVAKLMVTNALAIRIFVNSDAELKPGEECHRIDIGLRHPLVGYGEWEWLLDDHDLQICVTSDYRVCSVGMDG